MSFELVQKVVSSWKKSLYRHRKTIGVAIFFGILGAMAIAGAHPTSFQKERMRHYALEIGIGQDACE
jgi:hypothetical protein